MTLKISNLLKRECDKGRNLLIVQYPDTWITLSALYLQVDPLFTMTCPEFNLSIINLFYYLVT